MLLGRTASLSWSTDYNQSEEDWWWLRSLGDTSGSQTSSIDPGTPFFFFFLAVNLNLSPAQAVDCRRIFFINLVMLDCPLCNLPPTALYNIGCHSNDAQVRQRGILFLSTTWKGWRVVYIMHAQTSPHTHTHTHTHTHIHIHNRLRLRLLFKHTQTLSHALIRTRRKCSSVIGSILSSWFVC